MNWGKRILTAAALSAIFASGLVGCAKSSDNNNGSSGNISINGAPGLNGIGGQTASATDNVSGMPVSLTITTNSYYNNGGYNSSQASVMINNSQVSLPIMEIGNYGTQYINIGSNNYGQFSQYTAVGTAICADTIASQYQQCQRVAIIVWVQPAGYSGGQFNITAPAMQVGILEDQSGIIHSAFEKVGTASSINGQGTLSTAAAVTSWLVQNAH